jgi:ElaB/YqjD/DUF883 family membrane-anchored ribosome-binding protein
MATKKTTGSKAARGGNVSLADEDRRYLNETLKKAGGGMDEGSVFEALERFGLSSDRVQRLRSAIADSDVKESIDKASEYLAEQIENARDYTRENPKKVIGGAAGVLVGASLLALAIRRASGDEKKKRSAASSSSSSSSSSKKAAAGRKGGKATAKKAAKTR